MSALSLTGLLAALLMTQLPAPAVEPSAPDLDDILQKNLAAVRSPTAAVKNTEKILSIREAGYTLTARYRASADGHMRIDVFSDDTRVYSEGKDEDGVWEWPGGEAAPKNVYHDGVGALEHGIEFNLFALAELPGRGHQIRLSGSESLRGADYYVLEISLADGFVTYRYVNKDTWLVDIARDFRAFHPGIDSTRTHIETRNDRWQQTDGVLHASQSQNIDLQTGAVLATVEVLSSSYNLAPEALDLARTYVPGAAPAIVREAAKTRLRPVP